MSEVTRPEVVPSQAWNVLLDQHGFVGGTKVFLTQALSLSTDALHILCGTLAYLAFALVWRKNLRHPLPYAMVFTLACVNEVYDLAAMMNADVAFWLGESTRDLASTMALPTILTILIRRKPALFRDDHTHSAASMGAPDDGDPSCERTNSKF